MLRALRCTAFVTHYSLIIPRCIQVGARCVIRLIVHITHFYFQKHLTSGTELILIGWKIVPNEEHVQGDHLVPKSAQKRL